MNFSNEEIKHILRAWIIISIAFAFALRPAELTLAQVFSINFLFSIEFMQSLIIATLTVGTVFLLHELAHKYVAQRYGCRAEFRAFDNMLIFALILSVLSRLIFAAPGAVMIEGRINKARSGRISAVGPITNIILAFFFFTLEVMFSVAGAPDLLLQIAIYGTAINGWLALFNMIPIWQLDGTKVLSWNKRVYAILVIIAFFAAFILPSLFV